MRSPDRQPRVLRVRTPEDLIAFAPLALGFHPEHSLVVLTAGGVAFHARIDLPARLADVGAVVETVVAPARRHGARRVLLVLYGEETEVVVATGRTALRAFATAGVEVAEAVRVHADRWWPLRWSGEVPDHPGTPFDASVHPFLADAVLAGQVVWGSRAELAASLRPRPALVAQVDDALAAALLSDPDLRPLPTSAWVERLVRGHLAAGTRAAPVEVGRLLLALAHADRRDAAWTWMTREESHRLVDWWVDVVVRSPQGSVAGPAAVLGVTAWVAGQGALAWCAVERCQEEVPEHPLARLVGELLLGAVAPSRWDVVREQLRGAA